MWNEPVPVDIQYCTLRTGQVITPIYQNLISISIFTFHNNQKDPTDQFSNLSCLVTREIRRERAPPKHKGASGFTKNHPVTTRMYRSSTNQLMKSFFCQNLFPLGSWSSSNRWKFAKTYITMILSIIQNFSTIW